MKKSVLFLALATAVGLSSYAQDRETATYFESDNLKPKQGNVSTEFGLTGGILNSDLELNEGTSGLLKFRYFLNDDLALRLGANISAKSENDYFYGSGSSQKGTQTTSTSLILINVGIEKHFDGTRRLSPYVGGDFLIGNYGQSIKAIDNDGSTYVNNVKYTQSGPGTFSLGLRAVVGADFYIYKHLFVGAEAGLGFAVETEGDTKLTTTIGSTETSTILKSSGKNWILSPTMVTGIRIGFIF